MTQRFERVYLLEDRESGGEWRLADDAEPIVDREEATKLANKWMEEAIDEGYQVRVVTYQRIGETFSVYPSDGRSFDPLDVETYVCERQLESGRTLTVRMPGAQSPSEAREVAAELLSLHEVVKGWSES